MNEFFDKDDREDSKKRERPSSDYASHGVQLREEVEPTDKKFGRADSQRQRSGKEVGPKKKK